jgi:superfamily II DNA or RNA helicase
MNTDQYLAIPLQRTELLSNYRQLSVKAQTVLQLLAVAYEPIEMVEILEVNRELHELDDTFPLHTAVSLRSILTELTVQSLVVAGARQTYRCEALLLEILTREVVQQGRFEAMAEAIEEVLPLTYMGNRDRILFRGLDQFLRSARWAIYRHQMEELPRYVAMLENYAIVPYTLSVEEILEKVFHNPFDADWTMTFPQPFVEVLLESSLRRGIAEFAPMQVQFACLEEMCLDAKTRCSHPFLLCGVEQFILRNQLADAEYCLQRVAIDRRGEVGQYWAWLAFLRGEVDRAIELYELAYTVLKQPMRKRKVFFDDLSGVVFILALIQRGTAADLVAATEYASILATRKQPHYLSEVYVRLGMLLQFLQGDVAQTNYLVQSLHGDLPNIDRFFGSLCLYWCDNRRFSDQFELELEIACDLANFGEYRWLEMESAALLGALNPACEYADRATELRSQSAGMMALLTVVKPTEPWELSLTALVNLAPKPIAQLPTTEPAYRLIWLIKLLGDRCQITPKEQKLTTQGTWSKGRVLSLKRLSKAVGDFKYLTDPDRQACRHIRVEYGAAYYVSDVNYYVQEAALLELVGHPSIFWEDQPTVRVEIVEGEPELLVKKDVANDRLILSLSPSLPDRKLKVAFFQETLTRLRVIRITDSHWRMAEILGIGNELIVPIAAQDRVLAAIGAISGLVTVHSDIGGGIDNVVTLPVNPQLYVQLVMGEGGLRLAMLVKPFIAGGPYFKPGESGETVIAVIDGQRLQTTRDLAQEAIDAAAIQQDCRMLQEWLPEEWEWFIAEPDACLELLLELQALGDRIILEWPEGEKLRVRQTVSSGQMSVGIKRDRDWFEASGELQINPTEVMNMQELVKLLENAPGRFVPLGNGEFLALTQRFREQMRIFSSVGELHGDGLRLHPLAVSSLADTLQDMGQISADDAWYAQTQKLQAARDYQPEVPTTLLATLREYQIEGFEWLARLAHWGVGACLADDMGLGKTLQALAVMLLRSHLGPTLVVAPLSVSMNWLSETAKFAPSLRVVQLVGGDRQTQIDRLGANDLLVCSYGLLQQEDIAAMLAKVNWATIVLDEAQAIKNANTKRSKAAMKLQAGFKLVTTGTPIENHLGELWNLFRFINPGLLGTPDQFKQRFAAAIEKGEDPNVRDRLRNLIQPFMLRRTKDQVLTELPSRTEILLQVELSAEEIAFYEALRMEIVERFSNPDVPIAGQHVQVLAAIMKLRRACCNPALVQPKLKLKSAKLELFKEVLGELLDNGHKALVFSQFVDHLAILRSHLEAENISYQYLDGQTPAKQRQQRVEAFQSGVGDVFLISLKAGGTGLNLTAADYVIHMDPWWNPAVEDQASDRAYRMGQQRPVTIYRLVAKGTIEEQIVALHHQKRDLASSLLEGTDVSGRVSIDDLLRLIQNT